MGGDLSLIERLRVDQIADGFGLGEIDAAVEEGAHGELSGFGETRPGGDAQLDNMPQHDRRSVRSNLNDVVGSVGMRLGEVSDHDFVDTMLVRSRSYPSPCGDSRRPRLSGRRRATGLDQLSKDSPPRLHLMFQPQHRLCDLPRLRSGDAHDSNAAASGRRRDGDDRIVEIHRAIVAVKLGGQPAAENESTHSAQAPKEIQNLSVADELLQANEQFVKNFNLGDLAVRPRRRLAVLACMDSRILFERCLGLHPGDAHMIRNAGGIATDDALRSLIVSHHLLDTQEFIIINHTDCGLLRVREEELKKKLADKMGTSDGAPDIFMRLTIWKKMSGSRCTG